ncbi:putative NADH2 dehydrogenase [Serendipita vermifera]|nr:putative NADH2 dehydrogenase [Serendipita vermifera]
MTTIPSRLARPASGSKNRAHQAFRVRELYRDWYRSAPEICALYALNVSPTAIRAAIRQQFEENLHVEDPGAIERLILKGRQSYQETMNCWSQEPHIMGILLKPRVQPQRSFMQKFLESRDEDAVIPAAT